MSFANVAGERGLPTVGGAGSVQARVSSIMAIGLMSVLGLGMLGWYYSHAIARQSHAQQSAQAASKSRAQGDAPLPSLGRIDLPRMAPPMLSGSGLQSAPGTTALEPPPEVEKESGSNRPVNAPMFGAAAITGAPTKTPGAARL